MPLVWKTGAGGDLELALQCIKQSSLWHVYLTCRLVNSLGPVLGILPLGLCLPVAFCLPARSSPTLSSPYCTAMTAWSQLRRSFFHLEENYLVLGSSKREKSPIGWMHNNSSLYRICGYIRPWPLFVFFFPSQPKTFCLWNSSPLKKSLHKAFPSFFFHSGSLDITPFLFSSPKDMSFCFLFISLFLTKPLSLNCIRPLVYKEL